MSIFYFCWWIEDWEKPLLKKNDPVAREKLSKKYWGLLFCDIDNASKVFYTVSRRLMEDDKCSKEV